MDILTLNVFYLPLRTPCSCPFSSRPSSLGWVPEWSSDRAMRKVWCHSALSMTYSGADVLCRYHSHLVLVLTLGLESSNRAAPWSVNVFDTGNKNALCSSVSAAYDFRPVSVRHQFASHFALTPTPRPPLAPTEFLNLSLHWQRKMIRVFHTTSLDGKEIWERA